MSVILDQKGHTGACFKGLNLSQTIKYIKNTIHDCELDNHRLGITSRTQIYNHYWRKKSRFGTFQVPGFSRNQRADRCLSCYLSLEWVSVCYLIQKLVFIWVPCCGHTWNGRRERSFIYKIAHKKHIFLLRHAKESWPSLNSTCRARILFLLMSFGKSNNIKCAQTL